MTRDGIIGIIAGFVIGTAVFVLAASCLCHFPRGPDRCVEDAP